MGEVCTSVPEPLVVHSVRARELKFQENLIAERRRLAGTPYSNTQCACRECNNKKGASIAA